MNRTLMSSKRQDWETPWSVMHGIESLLGVKFDLDVCAKEVRVAKAPEFYTPEQNGLEQPWKGNCFCNPPYGREQLQWAAKALVEARKPPCHGVTLLLPARTDTQLFHHIAHHGEVILLEGRILFELDGQPVRNAKGSPAPAPFPSMLVTFSRYRRSGVWLGSLGLQKGKRTKRKGRTGTDGGAARDWLDQLHEVLG